MILIAFPGSISNLKESAYNIFIARNINNFMHKWKKEGWLEYKN